MHQQARQSEGGLPERASDHAQSDGRRRQDNAAGRSALRSGKTDLRGAAFVWRSSAVRRRRARQTPAHHRSARLRFSIEEIRELLAARDGPSKESAMALQALLSRHIEGLKRKARAYPGWGESSSAPSRPSIAATATIRRKKCLSFVRSADEPSCAALHAIYRPIRRPTNRRAQSHCSGFSSSGTVTRSTNLGWARSLSSRSFDTSTHAVSCLHARHDAKCHAVPLRAGAAPQVDFSDGKTVINHRWIGAIPVSSESGILQTLGALSTQLTTFRHHRRVADPGSRGWKRLRDPERLAIGGSTRSANATSICR